MRLQQFICEETGGASVDWVVLGAGCVGMALAVSEVTANAMAGLSQEVRAELTNTDPSRNYFDEIMNLAIFSDYVAYSDEYGSTWNDTGMNADGQNWAQAAYSAYTGMNDGDLLAQYEYHYEVAVEGDPLDNSQDAASIDHVAVVEHILNERGLGTPEDNMTAAEIRDYYENYDGDDDD